MNKRADTNLLMNDIVFLVLFTLFFLVMFWFVTSYSNGCAFYEDFYAKEIARTINGAEVGTKIIVDVTPLAISASKSGKPINDIVYLDNVNNKVVVSCRLSSATSFNFFNDVDVTDFRVESPSGSSISTRFIFNVKERKNEL